jgi:hypothetical protein
VAVGKYDEYLKEEKEKFESNQDREGDGVCAHVA